MVVNYVYSLYVVIDERKAQPLDKQIFERSIAVKTINFLYIEQQCHVVQLQMCWVGQKSGMTGSWAIGGRVWVVRVQGGGGVLDVLYGYFHPFPLTVGI